MSKNGNDLNNTQNEINQFDNMTTGNAQGNGNRLPYRPVARVNSTTTFRADEKPAVAQAKPKKKFPVKIVAVVLGILLVVVAVFLFVPQLNKTVTVALQGVADFKRDIEFRHIEEGMSRISEIAGKFPQLATDNGVKGTATVTLSSNTYMPNDLSGEYVFDFDMITKEGSMAWFSEVEFAGTELGEFNLYADYSGDTLYVKPTMFTDYIEVDNTIFLDDCDKFFVSVDEETREFFKSAYNGMSWTTLFTELSSADKVKKIVTPYTDLLHSIKYSGGVLADSPTDIQTTYGIEATAEWGTIKPVLDEVFKKLKTDSAITDLAEASGLKKQYFVSKIGELSDKLNIYCSKAGNDAIVKQQLWVNGDDLVRFVLSMPCDSEGGFAELTVMHTDNVFQIKVTEGDAVLCDIAFTYTLSEEKLTAEGTVQKDGTEYTVLVQDLELGNITTGIISVTNGATDILLDLSNDGGQGFEFIIAEDKETLVQVTGTLSTYPVTETQRSPGKRLSLYDANKDSVKSYMSSYADMADLLEVCNKHFGTYTDETKVRENIAALLYSYGMREYTPELPNTDIGGVYVDEETKRTEAMAAANENAENLMYSVQFFIDECILNEKNKYAITNGTYSGYVKEDMADLYYKAEFTKSEMESCIACSVSTGYYCVVIQNNKVLYAFWSAYDNIAPMIENKTLPSSFNGFDSVEDIIGTYPTPSKLGE